MATNAFTTLKSIALRMEAGASTAISGKVWSAVADTDAYLNTAAGEAVECAAHDAESFTKIRHP